MTARVLWATFKETVPARSYWDQTFLGQLFDRKLWTPPGFPEFEHTYHLGDDADVVVIPGAYLGDKVAEINDLLDKLRPCVLCITSDEELKFPVEKLRLNGVFVWVMYLNRDKHPHPLRGIPAGAPPPTEAARIEHGNDKDIPWYFAGQNSHPRRRECVRQLEVYREQSPDGLLAPTPGFAQGVEQREYLSIMARCKAAPAPGGNVTADSFRLWEALELGAVPLADTEGGGGKIPNYWAEVLGEAPPFPLIEKWMEAPRHIDRIVASWPHEANKCGSWLAGWKRRYTYRFFNDLRAVGVQQTRRPGDRLTVLMPTSVIPSHPDTGVIRQTLDSIRSRPELEGCEVIVMVDGLRDSDSERLADYEEYKRRLIRLCREYGNVWPMVFETHMHQAGMTADALKRVNTPAVMFVEHDTPLVGELPIEQLIDCVGSHADLIRLYHEPSIHPEHERLFLSESDEVMCGVPLVRTVQWSQRPHIASTSFYRRIISAEFDLPREKMMIEPRMTSVLEDAWRDYGPSGWARYKLHMYHPAGSIQRSEHLDGRGDDEPHEDDTANG